MVRPDLNNAPSLEEAELQLTFARRLQATRDFIDYLNSMTTISPDFTMSIGDDPGDEEGEEWKR